MSDGPDLVEDRVDQPMRNPEATRQQAKIARESVSALQQRDETLLNKTMEKERIQRKLRELGNMLEREKELVSATDQKEKS